MKKKLLVLLFMGVMLAGCADKEGSKNEKEPEVISLDLNETVQDSQKKDVQENGIDSSSGSEMIPSGAEQESQEQTQELSVNDISEDGQSQNKQDLYMQFLNNEVSVIVGDSYPQNEYLAAILGRGSSYTFAELGQYVNQIYLDPEYSEKTTYDYAQYAYVDCPDSDSQNFLIKFVGLEIYSRGDDSFAVYVLTEDNGQLYLTDMYECWARSYMETYRNGLCISGGSAGAGDHYEGMQAIMSNGKITNIYEAEIVSGWWASYVNAGIYSDVFGESMEAPLNVAIYTIDGSRYYTYDLSECTDDQVPVCETYINRCRDEAGINWITDGEVQELVKKRCSSMGVDYDNIDQLQEVKWMN